MVLQKTRRILSKLKKNISINGTSAFVFANGPSLSDIDLKKIKSLCETGEYDLICVNLFLSKSADIVQPRFAFFGDNNHFNGSNPEYIKDLDTCAKYGIKYFVPAKFYSAENNLNIAYCNLCNIDSTNTSDITKPAGYYGLTALFALSFAKMMGYKKIYMCGYDNSYFKDFAITDQNEMVVHHKHYYDDDDANTRHNKLPYDDTSTFFFDTYRHFAAIEKVTCNDPKIENIAKTTYLSKLKRNTSLNVYK